MCKKIRNIKGYITYPGTKLSVIMPEGYYRKITWGINNGTISSLTVESLEILSKKTETKRCVVPVLSFIQNITQFWSVNNEPFFLAGVYCDNNNEFAILTLQDKMPLYLTSSNSKNYLKGNLVNEIIKNKIEFLKTIK